MNNTNKPDEGKRKNKRTDSGIADFNLFHKNLRVLVGYGLHRSVADFARHIGLKDTKRLSDVELGRLKPTKLEIQKISQATGLSISTLCNVQLKLKLIINE